MTEGLLIALGGNAIGQPAGGGRWSSAVAQMRRTAPVLARVARDGAPLVLTHGNGPQVGDLLREVELASEEVPAPPLHVLDAETEGQIGYLIAQELTTALARRRIPRTVLPLISRMEVAAHDPAFADPSKPVGRVYDRREAARLRRRRGWTLREDPARGGWRRLVPSPRPLAWLEGPAVRAMFACGLGPSVIPVVAGGGGVPVVRRRGGYEGVDAVIDKDLASSVVARALGFPRLVIATDVPGAAVDFRGPRERFLGSVSASEIAAYLRAGEFGRGSMGPKVAAGLDFLEHGGREFVICALDRLGPALAGRAGTRVRAEEPRRANARRTPSAA